MASFIKRNGSWTARIRKTGYPETTQTFANKASALQWSQRVESDPDKFLTERVTADHQLVTLGDLKQPAPLLATAGFLAIAVLTARRVPGAIIIAILGVTALSVLLGVTENHGVVSMPPSVAPTFMQMDIAGALNAGPKSSV